MHCTGNGVQKTDQAHRRVVFGGVAHLWLIASQMGPKPALSGLSVGSQFILVEQNVAARLGPNFLQCVLYVLFFFVYSGSGLC